MLPGTLIIRADATAAIGHGHVMRCLALAQAWQDQGGECTFVMFEPMRELARRLCAEGFELVPIEAPPGGSGDAVQVTELAHARDARWVVVDGYQFNADYHRTLKKSGEKVLLIDDSGHTRTYYSDLVLDQNAGAHQDAYIDREPYTQLLFGSRYAMLRREFSVWHEGKREIAPTARKILVTMGGSDPGNLSPRVIQALKMLPDEGLEIVIVVGRSNPRADQLRDLVADCSGNFRIEVDPPNFPELMVWADLAISAAGSTCWEMCSLGLPAIVIDAADNQQETARELNRRDIALHIPLNQVTPQFLAANLRHLIPDFNGRQRMSARGKELIDGRGSGRVVTALTAYGLGLRRAAPDDCVLLWEWANDPQVRRASFSPGEISWEEHTDWFAQRIEDERSTWLMFEDRGTAAGTVRIQATTQTDGEISVTVGQEYRGRGLAQYVIERAVAYAFTSTSLRRVHALIRPDNAASSRAFEGAGFLLIGATIVRGANALHYVREFDGTVNDNSAIQPEHRLEVARCR